MEANQFKIQIERLKETYGDRLYPKGRLAILWREVENTPEGDFVSAIDHLISTERAAPMNDQILDSITHVQQRTRLDRQVGTEDAASLLENVPSRPDRCDPDFKDLCMKVLRSRTMMTKKEYSAACDELDRLSEQIGRGKKECYKCGNSGYQLIEDENGCRVAYRCRCSHGMKRPPTAIGAQRADGFRLEIPVPHAPQAL